MLYLIISADVISNCLLSIVYGEHMRLLEAGKFCNRDSPLLALVDMHGGISINADDTTGSECGCLPPEQKVILL